MSRYPYDYIPQKPLQGENGGAIDGLYVGIMARYRIAPQTAGSSSVYLAGSLAGSVAVTTGITNPTYPVALSVTGAGSAATGNVVIVGTDSSGSAITDTIALNEDNTVNGDEAFRTVTQITLPANTVGVGVGVTKLIGLPHILAGSQAMLLTRFDGANDAGTTTTDAALSGNLYTPAGTPDGADILDLHYIVEEYS